MLSVNFRLNGRIQSAIAGFLVRNAKGENIFGSNTARENYPLPVMTPSDTQTVEFHWTLPGLAPGRYYISLAVSDGNVDEFKVCDYIEDAVTMDTVGSGPTTAGYLQLQCATVAIHRYENV